MIAKAFKNIVNKGLVPKYNFSNQLSTSSLGQIKNSIAVIESEGQAICDNFYKVQIQPKNIPFFNKINFTSGRQAQTLSQFLLLLAQRSDNLEAMHVHLNRISAKHVGFGIKPEHYPVFSEGLIASFKDVLGTRATPEFISAWQELIGLVQQGLQENEVEMYHFQDQTAGYWNGTRSFVVSEVTAIGNNITNVIVKPEDGKPLAHHQGGQYLTLAAELPNLGLQYRHLVICNSPGRDHYRLTVQTPGNVAQYLANAKVGQKLNFLAPSGKFHLQGHFNDVCLIGKGLANTSLFGIANAARNRNVYYIQVADNESSYVMRAAVDQLAAENNRFRHTACYTDSQAFNYEFVTNFVPTKNTDFYFCSQDVDFAQHVTKTLRACGVGKYNMFFEFDGPYNFFL